MAEKTNVTDFLNLFPQGFARPNRYLVELMLPPGVADSGSWMNSESQVGTITGKGLTLNSRWGCSSSLPQLYYACKNSNGLSARAT
jgi:hypothetical protein